jgi:uncharacterized integral membrane protein
MVASDPERTLPWIRYSQGRTERGNSSLKADRLYILLAIMVFIFSAATFAMFSFPRLPWVGMDDFIWPTALVLWAIVVMALLFAISPYGRRALQGSDLVLLSYLTLLLYGMVGLVTLMLYPFRLASGI